MENVEENKITICFDLFFCQILIIWYWLTFLGHPVVYEID